MDITDGAEQLKGLHWMQAKEGLPGGLSCHSPQHVSLIIHLVMMPRFLAN